MRYYALRYTQRGSYTSLGRRCIVRTFDTAALRDAYVLEAPSPSSIHYDGRREAVPASTLVGDNGRSVGIHEAIPGL